MEICEWHDGKSLNVIILYRPDDLNACIKSLKWAENFTLALRNLIINHFSIILFRKGKEVGKMFLHQMIHKFLFVIE